MKKLPLSFYRRPLEQVAPELLGKILIRRTHEGITAGRIVEVEAYGGSDDPASHAYRGPGQRNAVMFEAGGCAYVYFIYGSSFCFNVVTGKKGEGQACLIRALEPITGIPLMIKRRGVQDIRQLTNGPGKLCIALQIARSENGISLSGHSLYLTDDGYLPPSVCVSGRMGIRKATEKPWRFYIEHNPFVSR